MKKKFLFLQRFTTCQNFYPKQKDINSNDNIIKYEANPAINNNFIFSFSSKILPYNLILKDLLIFIKQNSPPVFYIEVQKFLLQQLNKYINNKPNKSEKNKSIYINSNLTPENNYKYNKKIIKKPNYETLIDNRNKNNKNYKKIENKQQKTKKDRNESCISETKKYMLYKWSLMQEKNKLNSQKNNYKTRNYMNNKKIIMANNSAEDIFNKNDNESMIKNKELNKFVDNLKKIDSNDKLPEINYTQKTNVSNLNNDENTINNNNIVNQNKKPITLNDDILKKIKNSLDDDDLKGMLNFSYENFLSKESEQESKDLDYEV